MIRDFVLAVGFVLVGSTDWALTVQGEREPTCAKSERSCEAAREAIKRGFLPSVPRDVETSCSPYPGCFDEESNCIRNFNCR